LNDLIKGIYKIIVITTVKGAYKL